MKIVDYCLEIGPLRKNKIMNIITAITISHLLNKPIKRIAWINEEYYIKIYNNKDCAIHKKLEGITYLEVGMLNDDDQFSIQDIMSDDWIVKNNDK